MIFLPVHELTAPIFTNFTFLAVAEAHRLSLIVAANFLPTCFEGHSINKLQNSVILLVFQIWKNRDIRFVENFIFNIWTNIFDDDIIIVMSYVYRKQSICVLFCPPVIHRKSQVTNHIETKNG